MWLKINEIYLNKNGEQQTESAYLNLGESKEESEYSIKTCTKPALNLPGNPQKCEAGSISLFVVTAPCLFKHRLWLTLLQDPCSRAIVHVMRLKSFTKLA